jgi:hypothetical protein
MNIRPFGGHSSETRSHPTDMNTIIVVVVVVVVMQTDWLIQ